MKKEEIVKLSNEALKDLKLRNQEMTFLCDETLSENFEEAKRRTIKHIKNGNAHKIVNAVVENLNLNNIEIDIHTVIKLIFISEVSASSNEG